MVDNQFAPEDENYYQGLFSNLLIIIWAIFLLVLIFVIFLVGRLGCKGCEATLDKEDGTFEFKRDSHVVCTWIMGLLLMLSLSSTLYGSISFFAEVSKAKEQITT